MATRARGHTRHGALFTESFSVHLRFKAYVSSALRETTTRPGRTHDTRTRTRARPAWIVSRPGACEMRGPCVALVSTRPTGRRRPARPRARRPRPESTADTTAFARRRAPLSRPLLTTEHSHLHNTTRAPRIDQQTMRHASPYCTCVAPCLCVTRCPYGRRAGVRRTKTQRHGARTPNIGHPEGGELEEDGSQKG